MISPAEIKKKALRRYADYLSSIVAGESFFPLDIRFGKSRPKGNYHEFDKQRATLVEASKAHQGMSYTVELASHQTRRYGEQFIPSRIYFERELDYLNYIGKSKEVQRFRIALSATKNTLPSLLKWLQRSPLEAIPYLREWPELLQVCQYFEENPQPGCFIRELPLEVHTKFIEEHIGVLRKMLEAILPEDAYDETQSRFAPRFGLREAEALVRIRCLTARAKASMSFTLEDIGIPVSALQELNFWGLKVVIVENLMTYLTLPYSCGDVVIFGKGFQVGALKKVKTLRDAQILYWGDLDAQGFMILSQLKSAYPHAISALMDRPTFDAHESFAVRGTPCTTTELPRLTDDERVMFNYLRLETVRLEQERIPLAYVKEHWPKR